MNKEHDRTNEEIATMRAKTQAASHKLDAPTYERYAARAAVLKAMAHPARLFILDELARGERCVAELTAMIGRDVSTISRHLGVLRASGILRAERRGAQVYYQLRMPCVLRFFGCIEAVIESSAREQMKLV